MRRFWDYRVESVEQVKDATDELIRTFGDPLGYLEKFRKKVDRATRFKGVRLRHLCMEGYDVALSYTVPERMFGIAIDAEKPESVYNKKFAPILRKHMRELKRVKEPTITPVLILVESDEKENADDMHKLLYIR